MRTLDEAIYVAQTTGDAPPEVGFFTWDVPENVLYADRALADLFGLDATASARGLAIEAYLDRVHPHDRPRLAKTIRDSIVTDRPQQETYRVMNTPGNYVLVTGFGRGFRNHDGDIARYVGIVVPVDLSISPTPCSH
jgi:PAS domain-containing protein